jgi:hypothetical protein
VEKVFLKDYAKFESACEKEGVYPEHRLEKKIKDLRASGELNPDIEYQWKAKQKMFQIQADARQAAAVAIGREQTERLRQAEITRRAAANENRNVVSRAWHSATEQSVDHAIAADVKLAKDSIENAVNKMTKEQMLAAETMKALKYLSNTKEGQEGLLALLDRKDQLTVREETQKTISKWVDQNPILAPWLEDDFHFHNSVSQSPNELKGAVVGTAIAGAVANPAGALHILGRMAIGGLSKEAVRDVLIQETGDVKTANLFAEGLGIALGSHIRSGEITKYVAPGESTWNHPPVKRGQIIETNLGHNTPPNTPVIDRLADQKATSIKSLDLNAATYQNPSQLKSVLTGYTNKMIGYNQGRVGDETIRYGEDFTKKALDVAVPHSGTTAQQSVFKEIIDYGKLNGIEVNIIVYP